MTRAGATRAEWLLGLGVLLARVPFLGAGYGTDPDAWRVAWTGRVIAATGAYQSSRAPGNPIPELAAAALSGFPAWALNGVTALFGAAAVMLFGRLLRRLGSAAWVAGTVALAFTPVVAIHSADAMDYLWALAFVMAGLLAALDGRAALAGFWLGLAAGCRLSSLAMLVPVAVLLAGPGARARLPRLIGTALAAAAAAFAPVIARYGASFLHGYENGYPPLVYVLKNLTVDVWGAVGTLAVAAATLAALLPRRSGPPPPAAGFPLERRWLVAAGLGVAVPLALFLRLPHEAAYLIPAIPFALLLLVARLTPRGVAALAAALVVSSLTFSVSEKGKPDAAPPSPLAATVRPGGRALVVDALQGPLLRDLRRRENGVRYIARVREAARATGAPTVVVAYEWLPMLRVLSGGNREGEVEYVYLLDRARCEALVRDGIAVVDLPGAEGETWKVHGYDLRAAGARPLEVPSGPDSPPAR